MSSFYKEIRNILIYCKLKELEFESLPKKQREEIILRFVETEETSSIENEVNTSASSAKLQIKEVKYDYAELCRTFRDFKKTGETGPVNS